jgi:hypothetical protein
VPVAILGWIRCGVPLTGRSGAQHSFNRISGIDSHVVLWHYKETQFPERGFSEWKVYQG